jgi:hypothetical protein
LTRLETLAATALLILVGGCERRADEKAYQVFTGVVRALDVETGEVLVRPDEPPDWWHGGRTIFCVATKDSEVYVNDRFAGVEEIRVGDTIEVIGYRDGERFVVNQANIARPEPPATEPALAPASQPRRTGAPPPTAPTP